MTEINICGLKMERAGIMNKRKPPKENLEHENINDLIKRYESFIHSSRDVILFIRYDDGQILEANTAAINIYQYTHDELLTKTLFDLRAPETRDQLLPQMAAAATSGVLLETVHVKKSGERFPVEVNSQGAVIGKERVLLSIVRDITERKLAQQLLQESENNLRALLNAVTESFFLMNNDGIVLAANETVAKRYKLHLDAFIGSCIYNLIDDDTALQRKAQAEHVIRTGKPVRFEDVRFNRNIDQVFYPVFDGNGKVVRIAVFGIDITDRRKMEKKLQAIALTDELTGLYNRRGFLSLAERQIKLSRRNKTKLLLFFVDLDGMKKINDNLGHEEGDKALISAARVLVQTFRESDILSRMGGDEFAILAVNADTVVLDVLMRRFQKFIDYLNTRKAQKYKLSMSIGYALYDPKHPCTIDELISNADKAMYEDKSRKKVSRS
jgi:diguanylate cyclase (GGDEF)-like protein/PAS domain S-box-containing protein